MNPVKLAALGATATVALLSIGVTAPASAGTLPQGESTWVRPANGASMVMVRSGRKITMRFTDITYTGTIRGHVLRLRGNDAYSDGVTYNRFRSSGGVLRIKWEGNSGWTRFNRTQ